MVSTMRAQEDGYLIGHHVLLDFSFVKDVLHSWTVDFTFEGACLVSPLAKEVSELCVQESKLPALHGRW